MREPTQPREVLNGRARVLDGDTIELNGSVRVRFFGVDAPEYDQMMLYNGEEVACGQIAKQALKDRIAGQPVRCEVFDVDHYGRKCAVVFNSQGEDLNAWLCREGYVVAFTKVTRRYVGLEQEAKAARRGVWGGQMQEPADYRRDKRQQSGGQTGGRPQSGGQMGGRPQSGGQMGGGPPAQQGYHGQQQQQPHQASGGHAPSSGGSGAHWLVKLLEAVLGACMGGNKGRR